MEIFVLVAGLAGLSTILVMWNRRDSRHRRRDRIERLMVDRLSRDRRIQRERARAISCRPRSVDARVGRRAV